MKNKKNPDYSTEAGEVLSKWKPLINGVNNNNKGEKINKDSNVLKVKSEPSVPEIHNSKIIKSLNHLEDQNEPKKLKLSILDYKVKKEAITNNGHENEANNKKDISLETLNNLTSNNHHAINRLEDKELCKSSLAVPMPTLSLDDIFSDSKPAQPVSNLSASTFSNLNTSKYKNSFSKPPVSLFNEIRTCIGGPSEDEVLSNIFSSKHSKKFLYTGRRPNHDGGMFQPSRLYDLASRVLVDHLDDLPTRIATHSKFKKVLDN